MNPKMFLVKHRRHEAFVLWEMLSGWRRRAADPDDSLLQVRRSSDEDACEEAVREVRAHSETTSRESAVVLGLPATAALDELFDSAGIDRDLGCYEGHSVTGG
jgi:hypothetical protein